MSEPPDNAFDDASKTVETEPGWFPIVRQLCTYLEANDDRLDFVTSIDKAILKIVDQEARPGEIGPAIHIDEFVERNLARLVELSAAKNAHLYADNGEKFDLLASTGETPPASTFEGGLLPTRLNGGSDQPVLLSQAESELLSESFRAEASLVIPVFTVPGQRFGLLVLTSPRPQKVTPLSESSEQSFALTVARQLSVGIRDLLHQARTHWFQNLVHNFFQADLDPEVCFAHLALQVPSFLPSFRALTVDTEPQVQVVLHRREGDYLRVVGTTSDDLDVKLDVKNSVIGLLFKDRSRDFVLGDPETELREHYRSYLGERLDAKIRTELAVPVVEQPSGDRIAAINLESTHEKAFSTVHVEAMQELGRLVSPIVSALDTRITLMNQKRAAAIIAQHAYWEGSRRTLGHNVTGPLSGIRMAIDTMQSRAEAGGPVDARDAELFSSVKVNVSRANEALLEFMAELSAHGGPQKRSIQELAQSAIKKVKESSERPPPVGVTLADGPDFSVYCSLQLVMHLFNVLENALYWVKKRIEDDGGDPGEVRIEVREGPRHDSRQEQALNRSCEVVVVDNGTGIPAEKLAGLLEGKVESGRADGQGLALFAMYDYLRSMDGRLFVNNRPDGSGVEVRVRLPLYDSRVHGATVREEEHVESD